MRTLGLIILTALSLTSCIPEVSGAEDNDKYGTITDGPTYCEWLGNFAASTAEARIKGVPIGQYQTKQELKMLRHGDPERAINAMRTLVSIVYRRRMTIEQAQEWGELMCQRAGY